MAKPTNYTVGACRSSRVSYVCYKKNACSENQISWIFGLFLKMRLSENPTTEIRRSQGPGVNRKKTVVVPNKFFMLEIRL